MGLKLKIGLAALVAVSMLSGCASTVTTYANLRGYRQHVEALVGQSTDELQIQLGKPSSISALPDGRKEWTYFRYWEYPGWESVSGTRTETQSESYKDENGKTKYRDVTYTTPIYSPPRVETDSCTTIFVISLDNKVESVRIPKELGYSTSCTGYELPSEKRD